MMSNIAVFGFSFLHLVGKFDANCWGCVGTWLHLCWLPLVSVFCIGFIWRCITAAIGSVLAAGVSFCFIWFQFSAFGFLK